MTLSTPDANLHDEWHETPRRRRRWLAYVIVIVLILAIIAIARWRADAGAKANAHEGRPAAAVNATKVALGDMPVTLSAVGTVTPVDTAVVEPQLSGNVFQILFREGQVVHKGQVIAQIDPRPYRLTLMQAQGTLAHDQALLANARLDLQRYQKLAAQDSVARQTLDTQAALVRQYEGTVAADSASVGTAKLNLQYTSVQAPMDGWIGLKQVSIGTYVTPSTTNGIATVTSADPIDIEFALPQSVLGQIRKAAAGGVQLPVTAFDQDGVTQIAAGHFLTLDNQIGTTTGTVNAKARFDNPGDTATRPLFPNQFVNVRVLVDTLHHVAIVPVTAVRHGAPGDFVYVVQPNNTVKLTVVKTGPSLGTNIAVLNGLQQGQTIVTEGADGLDDGSKVRLPGQHGRSESAQGAEQANSASGVHRHHKQGNAGE